MEAGACLSRPRRLYKKTMLLPEIPGRGGHNGTLAYHDLTVLFERLPHIILADEIDGSLRCGWDRG